MNMKRKIRIKSENENPQIIKVCSSDVYVANAEAEGQPDHGLSDYVSGSVCLASVWGQVCLPGKVFACSFCVRDCLKLQLHVQGHQLVGDHVPVLVGWAGVGVECGRGGFEFCKSPESLS